MKPAPRRSAPSFRETTSRTKTSRRFSWRLVLSILVALGVATGVGWFLTRQPRGYECVTNINTVCPPEIEKHFAALQDVPLWQIQQRFLAVREQNQDPRLVTANLSLSPLQKAIVRVELADSLFPLSAQGKSWQMLSNGKLLPSEEAFFPNLEFNSQEQAERLSESERQELKTLYQRSRTFTPRIRKILVLTSTEVEVYPENTGKILFTLQEVERQLATLQAFFRSTTINQTYQVLDVRFSEVAVIKE